MDACAITLFERKKRFGHKSYDINPYGFLTTDRGLRNICSDFVLLNDDDKPYLCKSKRFLYESRITDTDCVESESSVTITLENGISVSIGPNTKIAVLYQGEINWLSSMLVKVGDNIPIDYNCETDIDKFGETDDYWSLFPGERFNAMVAAYRRYGEYFVGLPISLRIPDVDEYVTQPEISKAFMDISGPPLCCGERMADSFLEGAFSESRILRDGVISLVRNINDEKSAVLQAMLTNLGIVSTRHTGKDAKRYGNITVEGQSCVALLMEIGTLGSRCIDMACRLFTNPVNSVGKYDHILDKIRTNKHWKRHGIRYMHDTNEFTMLDRAIEAAKARGVSPDTASWLDSEMVTEPFRQYTATEPLVHASTSQVKSTKIHHGVFGNLLLSTSEGSITMNGITLKTPVVPCG